ncbi:hypothetical protein [Brevibacillus brevis]|uniref:hypothetical protein n=1 Tax=Brevibacillus brevis TaxID=1393 RepID=UPI001C8D5006|nr:hypothetical protein [Brevibacillus brevis]MBY0083727.1 hypothetical protein [Brevibacillus brevis]
MTIKFTAEQLFAALAEAEVQVKQQREDLKRDLKRKFYKTINHRNNGEVLYAVSVWAWDEQMLQQMPQELLDMTTKIGDDEFEFDRMLYVWANNQGDATDLVNAYLEKFEHYMYGTVGEVTQDGEIDFLMF